ncbi:MAG: OmpA family protein [Mangrovibacterium sp.]
MKTQRPYLLLISFALLLLLGACSGQRTYRKGMDAVEIGEYHKTTDKLRKSYRKIKEPELRMQMAFNLGEAYSKLGEYSRAAIWYKNAIRREHPNPNLNLLTAEALSAAQKYNEAKEYYEAHLAVYPTDTYAATKLRYCDSIAIWQKEPSRYEVELLKRINSRDSDYAAFYSSVRGNEIIFSSMRENELHKKLLSQITGQNLSQIYRSTYDLQRKRWETPELVGAEETINTFHDNGAAAMSPTGDMLLFTRCETNMEHDMGSAVYQSNINRGQFANPEKLDLAPDSLIAAHPFFSMTGDTVFFCSNLDGGYGGTDIWMSRRVDGAFEAPINLGEKINSAGNETFPTTDYEGNLYFSSDTWTGFGGYDIFKASIDESGEWQVSHMPSPINSHGDDMSLTFLAGSSYPQGLFISNRKGSKSDDIYSFKLPPMEFELRGMIYDKNTKEALDGARVRVIATDGTDLRIRANDGLFKVMLKPDNEYVFAAYKDDFLSDKIRLSTIGLSYSEVFSSDLFLTPIDKPIAVENINYEFGSASLTEGSKIALDTVIDILNTNPNITIELMSHSDHVGSNQANSILSQQRAQSVVDYLITRGVDGKRLVAKGYGESSPKQVTSEIAQQYPFLKKGDVLTESFINKLSEEDQEIAKSLNRRTEFRVLSTDYQEGK